MIDDHWKRYLFYCFTWANKKREISNQTHAIEHLPERCRSLIISDKHRKPTRKQHITKTYGWSCWGSVVIFFRWLTYERGSCWRNEFVFFAGWSEFIRRPGSRMTGWTNANGFLVVDGFSFIDEIAFEWDIDETG